MKKLGIFITTHIIDDSIPAWYRHGTGFGPKVFNKLKIRTFKGYKEFKPGLEAWDLCIIDTGCTYKPFLDWLEQQKEEIKNLKHIKVPNQGGVFAGIKHVMHTNSTLMNEYEYFFFHTDDSVHVAKDDWALSLINCYEEENKDKKMGIMGREFTTIRLGPQTGLIDHRYICQHIAEMYGITELTNTPHLQADWWFLNQETIKHLAKEWYNPIKSNRAMSYQRMLENTDYVSLARIGDNRKTLDDFHIGRETEIAMRLQFMGRKCCGYKDNAIIWEKTRARYED